MESHPIKIKILSPEAFETLVSSAKTIDFYICGSAAGSNGDIHTHGFAVAVFGDGSEAIAVGTGSSATEKSNEKRGLLGAALTVLEWADTDLPDGTLIRIYSVDEYVTRHLPELHQNWLRAGSKRVNHDLIAKISPYIIRFGGSLRFCKVGTNDEKYQIVQTLARNAGYERPKSEPERPQEAKAESNEASTSSGPSRAARSLSRVQASFIEGRKRAYAVPRREEKK